MRQEFYANPKENESGVFVTFTGAKNEALFVTVGVRVIMRVIMRVPVRLVNLYTFCVALTGTRYNSYKHCKIGTVRRNSNNNSQ